MTESSAARVIRRLATAADLDLIYSIRRAALGAYVVKTWGAWDEAAERQRFDEITRVEDHSVLELDGVPIGCICLKKSAVELRLIRLFILPEFQNRGFGTQILKDVLQMAASDHLPIRLRVLRVNPARRFYERHGFSVVGENETHYTMAHPA